MKLWKVPPSRAVILRYLLAPPMIGLLITLVSYPEGFRSFGTMLYIGLYSYSIGLPSIALISLAGKRLNRKFPWLINPFKRLVFTVVTQVFIVLLVLLVVQISFLLLYRRSLNELFGEFSTGFIWAVSITIVGISIANGVLFFKNWRQSALNEEILKREKLAIEYEALRNQVNPHFLFNSLTALTTLVHQDAHKAEAFIRKFSDVYRYILENRNLEVISLKDELQLIENMAYLYEYRHGENLRIDIELDASETRYILPMALQMLLENALKHNVISEARPLKVRIFEVEDGAVVRNNLQLKESISDSNRVGLDNIRLRYSYLCDRKVEIEQNDEFFQVRIPILEQT